MQKFADFEKLPLGTRGRYIVVFLFIRFSDLLVVSARQKKKELKIDGLIEKIGVDTAANEPLKGLKSA